jgi:hypothetical protein
VRRKTSLGEIREFIYLDETAVESMLAAVDGEILVETTGSSSQSREFSLGGTRKGDASLGSPEISTGFKLGRTSAQQEVRKSVAQSAFARFRSKNQQSFVLRRTATLGRRTQRRIAALDIRALRKFGAGVRVDDLRRGDLIELEVTLSAADSYQVRTAINSVADVVSSFPELLPIEQKEVLRKVRPVTALIDNLNGEAVPVVAALPNLRRVSLDGEDWLVLTPGESNDELELHAVTFPRWFWGDLGRTLFQSRRYTVLCRVLDPELKREAATSYVGAILSVVHPGLAATVDNIGPMMLGALRHGTERAVRNQTADWLLTYAQEVAGLTGNAVGIPDLSSIDGIDVRRMPFAKQLELFRAVDALFGLEDGEMSQELSDLRISVRDRFRLWPWSQEDSSAVHGVPASMSSRLEVELVAAYW